MPVEVFNQTLDRDEAKVFGENTSRRFKSIAVPSIEDFEELDAQLKELQRQNSELLKLREIDVQALQNLSERSLDRPHAEQVIAELKLAISDTSVFTNALFAALDAHEQRIGVANAKVHQEVTALQQQSHASALAAQRHLDDFQNKSKAIALSQTAIQTELKVMLSIAHETQAEIQAKAADADTIKQVQAWSEALQRGGLWARLVWLFRGKPSVTQSRQNL